jgi:cation diffusion facilitator family transporter
VAGAEAGTKATIAALFANAGIAVSKFVAFVFTGSASLLAEGIHSVADTSNQALLLLGMKRARRKPTPAHPFGYGRERYFWSFIVAVVLFTLGGVFSIYEGLDKVQHPHEIESFGWAFSVLSVAVVLELFSLRTAVHEANTVRIGPDGTRVGWWSFIRHSKVPELPVVLLEDLGALFGLIFALAGVTLTAVTGEPRWDAVGSLAIGALLGLIAITLAIELRSLLIGESASPRDLEQIEEAVRSEDAVEELLHARTQHIGPDELLVGIKVRLRGEMSLDEVVATINRVEQRVRERVPAARALYIEPDTTGTSFWTSDT